METLVTIIIPIYNVENYVTDCINSVKEQTYKNLQVICVDDCSTDNSYDVVKDLIANDSRFSLFRNDENRGLSYSRNVGMKSAKGEYILFLDPDDWLEKDTINFLMEHATKKCFDVVLFGFQKRDCESNDVIGSVTHSSCKEFVTGLDCLEYVYRNKEVNVSACCKFWKKDFLTEHDLQFYEGIVYEDTLFFINTMCCAKNVYMTSETLYNYRIRSDSISHAEGLYKINQIKSYIVIYAELLYLLKKYAHENRVTGIICSRLDLFANKVTNIISMCGNMPDVKFDNVYYQRLYDMLSFFPPSSYIYIRRIKSGDKVRWLEKNIYIYGAGKIAKEVIAELECNNIPITGLIVSGHDVTSLGKYSVQCVDDVNLCKDKDVVILGLARNFHREILDKLSMCDVEVYDILLR